MIAASLLTQAAPLPEVKFSQWLSAKEISAEFGVDQNTVYRWWQEGLPTGREIPRHYVRRRGFREYLFHPQVLEFLRAAQAELD